MESVIWGFNVYFYLKKKIKKAGFLCLQKSSSHTLVHPSALLFLNLNFQNIRFYFFT